MFMVVYLLLVSWFLQCKDSGSVNLIFVRVCVCRFRDLTRRVMTRLPGLNFLNVEKQKKLRLPLIQWA